MAGEKNKIIIKKKIKKEEEQKKAADRDTTTGDANYSGRVKAPCVCMIEGSWISIRVHFTNLTVTSYVSWRQIQKW